MKINHFKLVSNFLSRFIILFPISIYSTIPAYFAGKKIVYAVYAQMTIDIIFKHHQEIYVQTPSNKTKGLQVFKMKGVKEFNRPHPDLCWHFQSMISIKS